MSKEQQLSALLREIRDAVEGEWCFPGDLDERIDAALAGRLPELAVEVSETIRTAPERIWLQVGGQAHYHSEPFPRDTGEVTWCAEPVVGCEVPYVRADLAVIVPEGWQLVPDDYFSSLIAMARAAADKAMRKFPQPNYVLLKVAEEAGEVVQAGVHYAEDRMPWHNVEGEIVQLLAMLIRLVTEGDQVNGVIPPAAISTASPKPEVAP